MSKNVLWAYMFVFAVFHYAPTLLLPTFAFNDSTIIAFPLSGFTLEWFNLLWETDELHAATINSLKIATASACVATLSMGRLKWQPPASAFQAGVDLARLTEATLRYIVLAPGLLCRMIPVRIQPLNCDY